MEVERVASELGELVQTGPNIVACHKIWLSLD
jgi:hypothetical protein